MAFTNGLWRLHVKEVVTTYGCGRELGCRSAGWWGDSLQLITWVVESTQHALTGVAQSRSARPRGRRLRLWQFGPQRDRGQVEAHLRRQPATVTNQVNGAVRSSAPNPIENEKRAASR